jgi:hypothetical protein
MRKKLVGILVCILLTIGSVITVVASTNVEKQRSVLQGNSIKHGGNTLITELYNNRVIEVNSDGTIIWEKTGLNFPTDVERLANGNTLISEYGNNRVIEVDSGGIMVWEYAAGLNGPFDTERLTNGNTLISDTYANRVIEVNSGGTIVWEKAGLFYPYDAERLSNGNTLISEIGNNRVIEVDSGGTMVWEKAGLNGPFDAERLENGNTLITEQLYGRRVIEVDSSDNIVWQYISGGLLFDAERLTSGNTLITELTYYESHVIEVDSSGTIIWEKAGLFYPIDAERINYPPATPTICGQTSGKTGKVYEYTFFTVDPDGDEVSYYIEWGDGDTTSWTEFKPSSNPVYSESHSWDTQGTYIIQAKAKDIDGKESDMGTLEVNIPRTRALNHQLFHWLFERFPLVERLLSYLL